MNKPPSIDTTNASLARDLGHAARYYLGRPRVLLTLAAIAIVAGLAFNWNWLVAAGLAPILISVLPCLVMCALGACMMCRSSENQSAAVRDAPEAESRPTARAVAATDQPSTGAHVSASPPHSGETAGPQLPFEASPLAGTPTCCQGSTKQAGSERTTGLQSNQERRDSHA